MASVKEITMTQAELKEILDYNPHNGEFRWKVSNKRRGTKDCIAGTLHKATGYYVVTHNKHLYKAHRLAWLYVYGSISTEKFIDHIDGDKANNRITNLRLYSREENGRNVGVRSDNTSGFKGVCWNKRLGKWVVGATLGGLMHYLGVYAVKEDAVLAHKTFCLEHHGEFYYNTAK